MKIIYCSVCQIIRHHTPLCVCVWTVKRSIKENFMSVSLRSHTHTLEYTANLFFGQNNNPHTCASNHTLFFQAVVVVVVFNSAGIFFVEFYTIFLFVHNAISHFWWQSIFICLLSVERKKKQQNCRTVIQLPGRRVKQGRLFG